MNDLYLNHEEPDGSGSSIGPYPSKQAAEKGLEQHLKQFKTLGENWFFVRDTPPYYQSTDGQRLWVGKKR